MHFRLMALSSTTIIKVKPFKISPNRLNLESQRWRSSVCRWLIERHKIEPPTRPFALLSYEEEKLKDRSRQRTTIHYQILF